MSSELDVLTNLQASLIIASVSGVTLLTNMLSGALTISLPSIGTDLFISDDSLQWPLSMYSLTNAVFLLVFGGLADTLGRKTLFIFGTTLFAIGSLAVSFAPTSLSFIFLMAALGIAPAILCPAGAGILGATLPGGRMKNIAFASLGAGQPIGFILGLVAGGLLSTKWRAIFWMLSSLALSGCIASFLCIPRDVKLTRHDIFAQLRGFDWFGAILSTVGVTSLLFGLSDAELAPYGWSTPYIPALLPTSATFVIGFLWWEERRERCHKHALLPPSVWKAKGMTVMLVVIFLGWMAFNAVNYLCTLMYQQVQLLSPSQTALYFLPMCGSGLVVNILAGYLTGRVPTFRLVLVGLLMSAGASIAFSTFKSGTNYGLGMFWVMVFCVGPDLFFSAANVHIQNSVGANQQALAGSLFMIAIRLATSFGLAICSAISTAVSRRSAQRILLAHSTFNGTRTDGQDIISAVQLRSLALLDGLRAAGYACLVFTALSLVVAVFGLRDEDFTVQRTHGSTFEPASKPPSDLFPEASGNPREFAIELHEIMVPALASPSDKVSLYSRGTTAFGTDFRNSNCSIPLSPFVTMSVH